MRAAILRAGNRAGPLRVSGATIGFGGGVRSIPIKNLVLVGASIENLTFKTASDFVDIENRIVAAIPSAAGQVTVRNCSADGRDTAGAKAAWLSTYLPNFSAGGANELPYDSSTMVVFMCYGNDISNMRPYGDEDAEKIASIKMDLTAMISDCAARGWDWHIADISWRDYLQSGFEDGGINTRPYRDEITHALNLSLSPAYVRRFYSDGVSWLDYYSLFQRNASLLSDAIHPAVGAACNALRQEIVDKLIAPSWLNSKPVNTHFDLPDAGGDAVGDRAVWLFNGMPRSREGVGAYNKDYGLGDLAADTSTGRMLPYVLRGSSASLNYNANGSAALSVPGYFKVGDLTKSLYTNGANVGIFNLKRLTPSATYEIVISASRGTLHTDLTRMTRIDLTVYGEIVSGAVTQTFSASNPQSGSTANYLSLRVKPTSEGVITFEMSNDDRISTSRFGYLGALSVKRVA